MVMSLRQNFPDRRKLKKEIPNSDYMIDLIEPMRRGWRVYVGHYIYSSCLSLNLVFKKHLFELALKYASVSFWRISVQLQC